MKEDHAFPMPSVIADPAISECSSHMAAVDHIRRASQPALPFPVAICNPVDPRSADFSGIPPPRGIHIAENCKEKHDKYSG